MLILIIYCGFCGVVFVLEEELLVELLEVDEYWVGKKMGNLFEMLEEWVNMFCF